MLQSTNTGGGIKLDSGTGGITQYSLGNVDINKKNSALKKYSKYLKKYSRLILNANKKDISIAKSKKMKISIIERLKLNNKKIKQIRNSINEIIIQ